MYVHRIETIINEYQSLLRHGLHRKKENFIMYASNLKELEAAIRKQLYPN